MADACLSKYHPDWNDFVLCPISLPRNALINYSTYPLLFLALPPLRFEEQANE